MSQGWGCARPPEQPAESRAPAGGDSPGHQYQHQGLLELSSQPHVQQGLQGACWLSAGKVVLRDGTFPWDVQLLRQDRQAAVSRWDLVCAALHCFRVACWSSLAKKEDPGWLLFPGQESRACPSKGKPPSPGKENQKQGYSKGKGGGSGLGIDLQSTIKNQRGTKPIIYSSICTK